MAKNRAQKKAQQKHRMEKAQRRRAQRMRTIRIWVTVAIVALVAPLMFVLFRGDDTVSPGSSASGSPSPGSSAAAGTCTAAKQGTPPKTYNAPPPMKIDTKKDYSATIQTNCGSFTVDLLEKDAPKTVNNFVFLAREGFFEGTLFHRVIPSFMIQGGDPKGNGSGDPGYKFEDETDPSDSFAEPGILAMANSGPNTNGSQFFVTVAPAEHLNGKHTIFGTVTDGMDAVNTIVGVPTAAQDKPVDDVVITKVTITEK